MPAKAKTGNFKSLSANAFLMSKAKYVHAREPKYIKITFLQQKVFVKLRWLNLKLKITIGKFEKNPVF